jgi:sterol desaturase/sphingolipid hydroxylase (fatty acid hydroxylase superfamily)
LALLALDLAIWVQHLASHKIPLFWRLHKVHHADRDIDVTTAVRFHPVEIALSMLWKIVVVVPLGAPPLAVLLFEVILNACAMFNHANIALPAWLDGALRVAIVTPDMHRVHHSVLRREHDSNYGFNLSLWDRLFRTYTAQPEKGHRGMTVGLSPYQTARRRASVGACFCRSAVRSPHPVPSKARDHPLPQRERISRGGRALARRAARRSSWGNSGGTARRNARRRVPAPAHN